MITHRELLLGVAIPFGLALLVLGIGWRPWRRRLVDAMPPSGGWATPIAVGGAFAIGYWLVFGRPVFPPSDAQDWLAPLAMAGGMIGAAMSHARLRSWVRGAVTVALAAGGLWLLLRPLVPHALSPSEFHLTVVACAAGTLVAWVLMELQAIRHPDLSVAIVLLGLVAASAPVLLNGQSAKLFTTALILAAPLGAVAALGLITRPLPLGRGGVMVAIVLLAGLLAAGHWLAYVTLRDVLLIFTAMPAMWAAELPGIRRLKPWQCGVIRIVAAAIPTLFAVVPALRGLAETLHEQQGYGY